MDKEQIDATVAKMSEYGDPPENVVVHGEVPVPTGFANLDWDQYNALDAVRSSWLKAMKRSPAACKLAMGEGGADTRAMRMGRALHARVLEPLDEKVIPKTWDGRTAEGKQIAAMIPADAIVLKQEDYDAVGEMALSLRTHPTISRMLVNASIMEQSIVWKRNERLCKARIDCAKTIPCPETISLRCDWVADIKSTKDIERFSPYAMTNYSYHCQAAWYLSAFHFLGMKPPEHFYFFVVANTAPFESAVFRLDGESLSQGLEETNALFDEFIQCEKDDQWTRHEKSLLVAKTFQPRQDA